MKKARHWWDWLPLAVVGVLAASIVLPQLVGRTDKAKVASAQADLQTIRDALETFRLDAGRYPTNVEGLEALRHRPSKLENWSQYLRREVPRDPWGRAYVYLRSGEDSFVLKSYGADGSPGGEGYASDIDG